MSAQIPTFDTVDLGEGTPSPDAAARWQEALDATPGAADGWETPEKIAVAPVYTEADTADLDFLETAPGAAPFLRGPYPTMYVNQPWT
ncbi:MAG TPA: methylmalonyl-CoA mutase, partial [Janibacter terrae]|nr:methylmalonyl-CoA mutase [Janibacter terrae]